MKSRPLGYKSAAQPTVIQLALLPPAGAMLNLAALAERGEADAMVEANAKSAPMVVKEKRVMVMRARI
mgnify:CR=1 FL=1